MQARPLGWFVLRLIAREPLWYGLTSIAWILFHTWPLVPGLLARAFFDRLQGAAGLNLPTIIALLVIGGLARMGVVLGGTFTSTRYGFGIRALLQRNLLAPILERPGATSSAGEAIATLRDDVEGLRLVSEWFYDVAAAMAYAGGALVVLLLVDARTTLLLFLPLVVVIGIAQAVRSRLIALRERSRAASAKVSGAVGEIFGAVQAIQVAGAEERVVAHLGRLGEERRQAELRDRLQGLWVDGVFEQVASAGAGLLLLVAAGRISAGGFTVGDFALFASYLFGMTDFTAFLGYLLNTYRQSRVNLKRLVGLLQGAPADDLVAVRPVVRSGPVEADRLNRLEIRGVSCGVLQDVSFEVERGSLTVITGRVGSGKSTLLRAVLGLLPLESGEIRWNGRPVADLRPPLAAYTGQAPALLSGTVRENILLGMDEEPERLGRAVRGAVLDVDLETVVGARGVGLSGGQAQRTAAARMLYREPELLVCDDIASALDVETERLLWERLAAVGSTCLMVSHRRSALARADQILLLADGRLVSRGTCEELLQSSEEFRSIFQGAGR